MTNQLKSISIRQAMIIFILMIGSPAIVFVTSYTSQKAEQASWLCPVVALVVIIIFLFMFQQIFNKYENLSMVGIMENVFGKVIAKSLGILYFIYITISVSYYIRAYAERINATSLMNISSIVYTCILLVIVAYILKQDIQIIARMNEIMLPLVVIAFMIADFLIVPKIKLSNLYPITHNDIIPVLHGGLGIISLWGYITFILMISDRISNKKNFFKTGLKSYLSLFGLTVSLILVTYGVFGIGAKNLTYSYFAAVQSISLFDTIERVEAIIVALWILNDFSLISIFAILGLQTLKSTFNLNDTKPMVNIYVAMLFFFSIYISNNFNEIDIFMNRVLIYGNLLLGFIIPFILYFTGKLRKLF